MTQVLTISEIESQFADEWILVVDPEVDENLEILSGQVVCHSKDRDEVYRAAVELRPKRSAIVYTGNMSTDEIVVL